MNSNATPKLELCNRRAHLRVVVSFSGEFEDVLPRLYDGFFRACTCFTWEERVVHRGGDVRSACSQQCKRSALHVCVFWQHVALLLG